MNVSGAAHVLLWEFWFVMVLFVHVTCGLIALASSWIPLTAIKGSESHMSGGMAFVRTVSVMIITAILLTLLRKNDPLIASAVRSMTYFTLYISLFTAEVTWQGVRIIRIKKESSITLEKGICFIFLILSALTFIYSLLYGYFDLSFIPIIGILAALQQVRYWQSLTTESPLPWLLEHFTNMVLSVMGAWTTFAVTTIPLFTVVSPFSLWLWLTPAIVFLPVLFYWRLFPPTTEYKYPQK